MRDSVRFERRVSSQDAAGGQLFSWVFVAQVRAQVKPGSGSEVVAADQREGRVPTIFSLRYLEGLDPSMRLVLVRWDRVNQRSTEQVYNILSAVNPDAQKVEHLVTATELVGDGP